MDFPFTHWQCYLFLRPIEGWDVSKITDMQQLFHPAFNPHHGSCNPDVGSWDVSKVENFVSQSIASMHLIFYLFISKTTKQSLTPFFSLSNITTYPIINNHMVSLLLLSQISMFHSATAFNQDISRWDVGSGTKFVGGAGLWESWSSRCLRVLSSAHGRCCCCRPWRVAVLFMHSVL